MLVLIKDTSIIRWLLLVGIRAPSQGLCPMMVRLVRYKRLPISNDLGLKICTVTLNAKHGISPGPHIMLDREWSGSHEGASREKDLIGLPTWRKYEGRVVAFLKFSFKLCRSLQVFNISSDMVLI
jgi:hypothetical protein